MTWRDHDDDIPQGAVGEIEEVLDGGGHMVRFEGKLFEFEQFELMLGTTEQQTALNVRKV